jgi:hypothetical protein
MILKRAFLILGLFILGCLPKVYFNQSFTSAERLPITKDGYIALPSGENFDGSLILETEKTDPKEIVLIKIHGTYLLTAEGFKNIWAIFPTSGDKAKIKRISLMKENESLRDPKFEVSSQTRCVILKYIAGDEPRSVFIDSDGDIDEKKCDDD